eukprot:363369-Chlamydomonas_euryale.AAC.7
MAGAILLSFYKRTTSQPALSSTGAVWACGLQDQENVIQGRATAHRTVWWWSLCLHSITAVVLECSAAGGGPGGCPALPIVQVLDCPGHVAVGQVQRLVVPLQQLCVHICAGHRHARKDVSAQHAW